MQNLYEFIFNEELARENVLTEDPRASGSLGMKGHLTAVRLMFLLVGDVRCFRGESGDGAELRRDDECLIYPVGCFPCLTRGKNDSSWLPSLAHRPGNILSLVGKGMTEFSWVSKR